MILALLIHDRGILEDSSLQGLSLAGSLATSQGVDLEAVLVGEAADELAPTLADYGVATTHLVHHDGLVDYSPSAWGASIAQLESQFTLQQTGSTAQTIASHSESLHPVPSSVTQQLLELHAEQPS